MWELLNDTVSIVRADGTKYENIPASVQEERIFMGDVTVPVAVGDRVERDLPSGQTEILIVTNVHLSRGFGGIPDFYEIDYKPEGVQQPQPTTFNFNVSDSPQTRVNLYSTDQSKNIINGQSEQLFTQIRELLRESIADSPDLDVLLERVDDMERSRATGDFTRAYRDFVAAAADHISILAPMLPALTSLL